MDAKLVKELPASEKHTAGMHITARDGQEYVVTQNPERKGKRFTLWHKVNGGFEKLKMADSPVPLSDSVLPPSKP